MKNKINENTIDRVGNVYKFYFLILSLLLSFLIVEKLITEFILHTSLTFFEYMIPSIILYGLLFGITLLYAHKTQINSSEMGFHSLYVPKSLIIGILATSGYLIAVAAFQMPLNYTSFVDIFIIGCFTLLIGLTKETMFRCYIQANYINVLSQTKAVLFTGILFAILHIPSYLISGAFLNLSNLPSLILIGLILGFIRIHTGNIWGVIIVHTTWNYYIFLFAPVITIDTEVIVLLSVLVSSLAMWGTIVLAMFLAKKWIDRSTQIPTELRREYLIKIQNLNNKNWKLQQLISSLMMNKLLYSQRKKIYSSRIKIHEEIIEILNKYISQINESNYKIIKQLVPLKIRLIKVENLMMITDYPLKISLYKRKKVLLENKIQVLESEFEDKKNFNGL